MSSTSSYTTVDKGTLIKAHLINGHQAAVLFCQEDREVLTASLALVSHIAAALALPRQSLHLVWGPIREAGQLASSSMSIGIKWIVEVSCAVVPFDPEDLLQETDNCFCCYDPCDDADLMGAPRSRVENCVRCTPCFLCELCRCQLISGDWCCLYCIEPGEEQQLSKSTRKRLQLVGVPQP